MRKAISLFMIPAFVGKVVAALAAMKPARQSGNDGAGEAPEPWDADFPHEIADMASVTEGVSGRDMPAPDGAGEAETPIAAEPAAPAPDPMAPADAAAGEGSAVDPEPVDEAELAAARPTPRQIEALEAIAAAPGTRVDIRGSMLASIYARGWIETSDDFAKYAEAAWSLTPMGRAVLEKVRAVEAVPA